MNYIKAAEMSSNNALLDGAIRQGLSLMRNPDISEAQFRIWVEYSKNLLGLISNNPIFMTNYLNVVIVAYNSSLTISQRLGMCLRYLIEIQAEI